MTSDIIFSAGAHAFGDGSHPTTAMVLAALEALDPAEFQPLRACDMGAGSGILSFAIAKKFNCAVVAVDIERQAVETLQENARANALDKQLIALHAKGFSHPAITAQAPYQLIVMNILAEPLLDLAMTAEKNLDAGGVLILSGLFSWQEPQLSEAYQGLGLELAHRLSLKEWVCLSFIKP
jgi:ribosomal protein L11 methyltransferase